MSETPVKILNAYHPNGCMKAQFLNIYIYNHFNFPNSHTNKLGNPNKNTNPQINFYGVQQNQNDFINLDYQFGSDNTDYMDDLNLEYIK